MSNEKWKLWKYESYDAYVQAQKNANIKKEKCIWVKKSTIEKIHSVLSYIEVNNVLCHGTRNGKELEYFSKSYPDANVVGSEISDTATKYANTVQWDFHDKNPDWINTFDIVYSNSFDHSYDPEKCLSTWKEQLSETGVLVIEVQPQSKIKDSDPLSITIEGFEYLIDSLGMKVEHIDTGSNEVPLYFIS